MAQPPDFRDRDEECFDDALRGAISAGEVTIVLAPDTTVRDRAWSRGEAGVPPRALGVE